MSKMGLNFCLRGAFSLLGFVVFSLAFADDRTAVERLSVFGKKEVLPTRPGSAHVLTEEELEKFNYNDIHRVLRSVPGVNIQEEDGFGLRPNIGLRGGHPHRSKKVTLMEDGVLIGPAPYTAPAAYYFPQMPKMSAVEVFKGVPSTFYGPNSIGGAINFVTRMNPPEFKFAAQYGNFNSSQLELSAGISTWGDLSIDLSNTKTDGFKELLDDKNTGFERQNVTLRWDKYFVNLDQNINLKFNFSDENSNETYAGLTDADFAENPYQRYSSTELDKMSWLHRQFFASYALSPLENFRVRTTLYHHRFNRSWNKLNGFAGTNSSNPSVEISEVLNNPDLAANNFYYQVLSGEADSGVLSDDRDVLDIGNNQRQYFSQGAQVNLNYDLPGFSWGHLFEFSYRLHRDGINRFHESSYYNMVSGRLQENSARNQEVTVLNEATSLAHTFALSYEAQWEKLTTQSILRFEEIDYEQTDKTTLQRIESDDELFAPGLGVFYQAFDNTGFLAGVNKAFTPVGPGQASNVNPEEAINYELGVRHTGAVGAEVIGFYSDYKNLLGTCTQSGGCTVNQLDQSFNGGTAEVLGVEALLHTDFKVGSLNLPLRLTTTYTQARFKNSFTSALNEWGEGDVQVNDPIPYIPDWQANLVWGVEWEKFRAYLNINYLGEMADQAVADDRRSIPSRFVSGVSVNYKVLPRGLLRLRIDNITNEKYAVSRRPFGLRPGRPLMAMMGFEYAFF